ncbi:SCP-like protein [Ancylostoma caninum]|uniref:SCP-like protein n=1 Tax=Ancylostoma caninum TaxID=29170 RepID=A0A368GW37_ANCCA|nr:SCP-like protein [Ancylostoma caninum]
MGIDKNIWIRWQQQRLRALHAPIELATPLAQKLQLNNDNIYTKADPATNTCKCQNNFKDCIAYLCQHDYKQVGDIPTRDCTAKDGMNWDLETIAVDMHNYYRRLVATGWAMEKKGGYAPTAKDMYSVKYADCTGADTLAQDTKTKVTDCPSTAPTPDVGRSLNYYYVTRYDIPEEQLLQEVAIKKWASQVTEIGVGKENIFVQNGPVTNYANMVHDKVQNLACAIDICTKTGASAVACQYDTPPIDSDPIYQMGKPCKCTGTRKCSPLQGLCVLP